MSCYKINIGVLFIDYSFKDPNKDIKLLEINTQHYHVIVTNRTLSTRDIITPRISFLLLRTLRNEKV